MTRNPKITIAAIAGGTALVVLSIVAVSFGSQVQAPEEVSTSSRIAQTVARTTEIALANVESSQPPVSPSAPVVVAPPPPPPAFAISCSPNFQPDEDNHGVTSCTVRSSGGFADPVQLSCTGPAGVVRCRTTPDTVTPAPNGSVKFRLDANTTQEVRSYVLVVNGSSGALTVTHKATMRLDYLGPDDLAPPAPPPPPAGATILVTCPPTTSPMSSTVFPAGITCFLKQLGTVSGEAQLSVTSSVPGVYVKPSMMVPGDASPLGALLPITIVPAEAGVGTHTLQVTATLGGYSSSSSHTFTIT